MGISAAFCRDSGVLVQIPVACLVNLSLPVMEPEQHSRADVMLVKIVP